MWSEVGRSLTNVDLLLIELLRSLTNCYPDVILEIIFNSSLFVGENSEFRTVQGCASLICLQKVGFDTAEDGLAKDTRITPHTSSKLSQFENCIFESHYECTGLRP